MASRYAAVDAASWGYGEGVPPTHRDQAYRAKARADRDA